METWLIEGDPSVAWQTMSFLSYDKEKINLKRSEMESKGWAKGILDKQSINGSWGEGLYSPKFISTTYSLLLLKRLGINHENKACQKGASLLIQGLRTDGGINFSPKPVARSETCISGMILNLLSYFKITNGQLDKIFNYIQENQMEDGGWNCEYPIRAKHASFNTTLLVLEGLESYKKIVNKEKNSIDQMEEKGREFLLNHRLYKSHTTGETVKEEFLRFPFPYHWKYDVLTALDYFQSSNVIYDERLEDAIAIIESKTKEGYIKNYRGQSGKVWFTMETIGKKSRFNTLRWQRILQWWKKIT